MATVNTPPEDDDGEFGTKVPDQGRSIKLIIGIAVIVIVLLMIGVAPRFLARRTEGAQQSGTAGPPLVNVTSVKEPPPYSDLDLPGTIDAVDQTSVVARAGGYVKTWLVDIGDQVHAGQTLAVIDTPDLDQELIQARAELAASQAAYGQTVANVSSLRAKVSESRSNLARARANYEESKTDLVRAQAEVAHANDAVDRAKGQVVQAQTSLKLADITAKRYQGLLADGAIDQQSTDQAVATYQTDLANLDSYKAALSAAQEDVASAQAAVDAARSNMAAYASGVQSSQADVEAAQANVVSAEATVRSAEANVQSSAANVGRIAAMQSFQNVTAPFSGVITARNVDIGSLVSGSGSSSSSGAGSVGSGVAGAGSQGNAAGTGGSESAGAQNSLFSIARLDTLRVYVNVPQPDVEDVHVGQKAQVSVAALPNQFFTGVITRTADALDPVSRTLVTEVHIANPGVLRPGMYADVHLRIPRQAGVVLVPDAALVSNAQGTSIAVIEAGDHVHFAPVEVGRDFGKQIEIISGLTVGERIIPNPSDGLREGETVREE